MLAADATERRQTAATRNQERGFKQAERSSAFPPRSRMRDRTHHPPGFSRARDNTHNTTAPKFRTKVS
jgi:hypothetical protein